MQITYHEKRLLWGKAEVNGSEGVGLMLQAVGTAE